MDRFKYMGETGGGAAPGLDDPQLRLSVLQKTVLGLMDRVSILDRDDVPDPLQVLCFYILILNGMKCRL